MGKLIIQKLKKDLPDIRTNVPLKNHTTFRIGGPARFFFIAKTKENLIKAIQAANKNNLPFFILGHGSNLLVCDKGYDGLVIKLQFENCKLQEKSLYAEAGAKLANLVKLSLNRELTGLEWAAGIPGTIGGAIRGNAGAFKKAISDVIKKVEVLDSKNLRFKIYNLSDCKFGYRDSIFKQRKNLIILSAEIKLKIGDKNEIQKKIKEYLNWRRKNQPLNFPSAGSVFKNPKKNSAGKLIEKCGLKGKKIGKARISEKHGNFIVNLGGARARDVVNLIQLSKKKVKEKFKIELKEEIQYL